MDKAQIRLECLSLAAKLPGRGPDEQIATASRYVDFVLGSEDKPDRAPRAKGRKAAADKAKAPAETGGETPAT